MKFACFYIFGFMAASVLTATANGQIVQSLDDTILLSNGGLVFNGDGDLVDTADAEDEFGGRAEIIAGLNGSNPRIGLFRFDVTALAAEINNPNRRVATATLRLNDRDGRTNPTGTDFSAYPLLGGNDGWVAGTTGGSGGGLTGTKGTVSLLTLSTPSAYTAAGSTEDPPVFDDGLAWLSDGGGATIQLDPSNAPINGFGFNLFDPDSAADPVDTTAAIGTATFNAADANGDYTISLDPASINALLPEWLSAPDTNAGIALAYADGAVGQWFFESEEGNAAERPEIEFTFEDGSFSILGDFDNDGDVDLADLDRFNGNIGMDATGLLEDVDLDGDGTVGANDFQQHYEQLVETSNGGKGTAAGDVNLDGVVNVLGDAFALVGNLNNPATSWSQGDLNADGNVNVLGDAFALVGNLGADNGGGAVPSTTAVPEPGFVSLMALAVVGIVTRHRR